MSSGGLESVGDDLFQPLTKISTTKEFELQEYANKEKKRLVGFDLSKCDTSWYLILSSSNPSILAFAFR
jgi:hypothetical protein